MRDMEGIYREGEGGREVHLKHVARDHVLDLQELGTQDYQ